MRTNHCPNCSNNNRLFRRIRNKNEDCLFEVIVPMKDADKKDVNQSERVLTDICSNCGTFYVFGRERLKRRRLEFKIMGRKVKNLKLEDFEEEDLDEE